MIFLVHRKTSGSTFTLFFSVRFIKNFVFSYLCNEMQLYRIPRYNAEISKMKAFVYHYYSRFHSKSSVFRGRVLFRNPKFVLLSTQIQAETEIIKTEPGLNTERRKMNPHTIMKIYIQINIQMHSFLIWKNIQDFSFRNILLKNRINSNRVQKSQNEIRNWH